VIDEQGQEELPWKPARGELPVSCIRQCTGELRLTGASVARDRRVALAKPKRAAARGHSGRRNLVTARLPHEDRLLACPECFEAYSARAGPGPATCSESSRDAPTAVDQRRMVGLPRPAPFTNVELIASGRLRGASNCQKENFTWEVLFGPRKRRVTLALRADPAAAPIGCRFASVSA